MILFLLPTLTMFCWLIRDSCRMTEWLRRRARVVLKCVTGGVYILDVLIHYIPVRINLSISVEIFVTFKWDVSRSTPLQIIYPTGQQNETYSAVVGTWLCELWWSSKCVICLVCQNWSSKLTWNRCLYTVLWFHCVYLCTVRPFAYCLPVSKTSLESGLMLQ